jgi:hypothetical protein
MPRSQNLYNLCATIRTHACTLRHTDYETGVIARMYADGSQGSVYNAANIAALAEDAAGEHYIIEYEEVAQIYALPNPPGIVGTTSSATGPTAPSAPTIVTPPVTAALPFASGSNAGPSDCCACCDSSW